MTEALRNSVSEKCATCPNRTRISRALARVVGAQEATAECEGPVIVSRGRVVTQVREQGQAAPPQSSWTSMVGSMRTFEGPARYNRTDWTQETECGQEAIEPRQGEVNAYPFDGEVIHTHENKRYAAFVKGTPQQIQDYMSAQALSRLDG